MSEKPESVSEMRRRVVGSLIPYLRKAVANLDLRELDMLAQQSGHIGHMLSQVVELTIQGSDSSHEKKLKRIGWEFAVALKDELDLESNVCKALSFIVDIVGLTNSAIFLPINDSEFTLGGSVNYGCCSDMLCDHMVDVLAPHVSRSLYVQDEDGMRGVLGEGWLSGSNLMAVCCQVKTVDGVETLAVIAVWRSEDEPFGDDVLAILETIAPMYAKYLARIVRVHLRRLG